MNTGQPRRSGRVRDRRGAVRDERGAVALIVALMFSLGVAGGFLALSADIGHLMWERSQLQAGADAAAVSLAQTCAVGPCAPGDGNVSGLADDAAADGETGIAGQCGSNLNAGGTLDPCPAPGSEITWTECGPLTPDVAALSNPGWVEVRTTTRSDGQDGMVGWFTGLLSGPAQERQSAGACSRAAWGQPQTSTGAIPIAVSACEWYASTDNGNDYAGDEVALDIDAGPGGTGCTNRFGRQMPAGFAWLDHGGDCSLTLRSNRWVDGRSELPGSLDCVGALRASVGTMVFLPVFTCMDDGRVNCRDQVTSASHESSYRIRQFAAFYVSGVDFGSDVTENTPGHPTPSVRCDAGHDCVYGWFVRAVQPGVGRLDRGAPDFGAYRVVLAG